jgi:hypothetical protein
MGEAKRRKAILGGRYGSPETAKDYRFNALAPKLRPDYGTHYVETVGRVPMICHIANAQILIPQGASEANINWNVGEYMATLIVTPEFALSYQQNPLAMLRIVPDPEDAYVTSLGEKVVPFKLAVEDDA